MKRILSAGAALLATTGMAHAVGLDRSNQDIGIIFETGNYAELSFGRISPDISGTDNDLPGSPFPNYEYDGVGEDFTQLGAGLKMDVTPQLSFALIFDQPFGVDISYPAPDAPQPSYLGNTQAELNSRALTAVGRYRINDRFSVHAGFRRETIDGNVTLSGLAYGGLDGYNVDLEEDDAYGYLIGAAYEIPDIAFRLAVTYHSSMEHEFDTTETVGGVPVNLIIPTLEAQSTTTVETPEAINIDFQTGIAADTLAFANVRYARYSDTIVSPIFFDLAPDGVRNGDSLTDIEDSYSLTLGVGRRFSDALSGSISVGYEPEDDSDLVSPLAPTNGSYSLALGAQYEVNNIVFSGGVRYTWLGDAKPETGTPDVARASFTDNDVVSIGMTVGYRF